MRMTIKMNDTQFRIITDALAMAGMFDEELARKTRNADVRTNCRKSSREFWNLRKQLDAKGPIFEGVR